MSSGPTIEPEESLMAGGVNESMLPAIEKQRSPELDNDIPIPEAHPSVDTPFSAQHTSDLKAGVTAASSNAVLESGPALAENKENPWHYKPTTYEPVVANGIVQPRTSALAHKRPSTQPNSRGAQGKPFEPSDPLRPRRHPTTDSATTPGRRSVHFVRHDSEVQDLPQSSLDGDGVGKERKGCTFFSKFKSLAVPPSLSGHGRSQSGYTIDDSMDEGGIPSEPLSPEFERGAPYSPGILAVARRGTEEGSSSDEREPSPSRRKGKRRVRRRSDAGPQTAPNTPQTPGYFDGAEAQQPSLEVTTSESDQPHVLRRRATMTDVPEVLRAGVSEDEGPHGQLGKESSWRRPTLWMRGPTNTTFEGRRPSNFRRLTGFGLSSDHAGTGTPGSRWRVSDWNTGAGAARWRALKAGFKLMGPKRKDEHKVDHAKSAELLAELTAGAPAALIFASMFQRDDHGHHRIPVLLEQLKVRLTDSKKSEPRHTSDRHQIFRIELEYGSGITRMRWVIHRSLRDFTNLHVRYKLQTSSDRYKHIHDAPRPKIPRFPRTAFPYLRGVRGLGSDDEDDGEDVADEDTGGSANEAAASGADKRTKRRKRRPSLTRNRRSSVAPTRSDSGDVNSDTNNGVGPAIGAGGNAHSVRKEPYPERQRKKLEAYLQSLIRHLMFHADSTRLCKFLELSSLGIRLAAEGSYHGKEGFLVIQSAKGLDFRKAWHPSFLAKRHAPKWFLVRHSYIVCVDSPEEMNIYDVFLIDPDFQVKTKRGRLQDKKPNSASIGVKKSAASPQHHTLKVRNAERKLKLLAKNERQLAQFEHSIKIAVRDTIWSKPHRFDSFAPVRTGVFAQWLVDGRDYMWNVSRAISMAKDVVYIHDWWLSPELYMRRPAAISRKWRLDRLLQRKAAEGVKIFVILYRNINSAVPIDSSYTKFSLLDLHPNVFVQRSPNQFRQNTFFWAHHEKICIVDHIVAFVGGLDLCFGRWDTPQHVLCDDKLTGFEQSEAPKDADHCQLWPGKDYSNPRVQDFYALDKPYEEMYDRSNVPRMPWHDIHMQIVGQPARDLTRHFVQRWNYILRQRKPTRPTPFLLPPPDFNPADLEALGLKGTCEVQILRSSCWWSMGTPDKTEHSIMNAYVKSIEQSEHYVYIENQFFISSCEVEGTRVENLIGDALVERAVRAHQNGEDWRAVIVIPLMPGFQNTVDSQDGTSVRLIMQCQYRSICRGESSIFGRLRAQHIEPEDYIQFYSLRSWGRIGPSKMLVTEQLYIHAKCMVVDDRIAIIGSANINERSMLGSRDSECAAIVRDTDMLETTMNGVPFLVGRFPHTLRMRLMREHLGIDVDELMEEKREQEVSLRDGAETGPHTSRRTSNTGSRPVSGNGKEAVRTTAKIPSGYPEEVIAKTENMYSFNHDVDWEQANNPNLRTDKKLTEDKRVTGNPEHKKDVEGRGEDRMLDEPNPIVDHGRDSAVVGGDREVLVVDVDPEGKGTLTAPRRSISLDVHREVPLSEKGGHSLPRTHPPTSQLSLPTDADPSRSLLSVSVSTHDVTDNEGPSNQNKSAKSELVDFMVGDMTRPTVGESCMKDPLSDSFHHDIWHAVAENNTKLFRHVFRCMPDNEVKCWKDYKEYVAYAERFSQAEGANKSKTQMQHEAHGKSGPPGIGSQLEKLATLSPIGNAVDGAQEKVGKTLNKNGQGNNNISEKQDANLKMSNVAEWAEQANQAQDERVAASEKNHLEPEIPEVLDEKAVLKFATPDRGRLATEDATTTTEKTPDHSSSPPLSTVTETISKTSQSHTNSQRRRRRTITRSSRKEFLASDDLMDKADAEALMGMVQGHLVLWPYDWLEREEQGGNWLYSIDQLAPLEI
ncbi:MAG: Phospholipase D1 [Peltula sp. TS41687]|nr:MAG: Phospholipase D1 [Peltula sp. TS41687]